MFDLPRIDKHCFRSYVDEMSDATIPPGQLDIREKLAQQMLADHDRKRQEIRYAPWQLFVAFAGLAIGLMTAGAALFAAGAAFIKLLGQ